jgi:hypothetical protein
MHDKWVLRYGLFATAKRWWGLSLLAKVLATAVGAAGVLAPIPVGVTALSVFGLTILSELFAFWSDSTKGLVQKLQDKLDLEDSLGWAISNEELRDIVFQAPGWVKKDASQRTLPRTYFASKQPEGVLRALENTEESAWWSRHLAWKMFVFSLTAILVILGLALVTLLTTAFVGDGDIQTKTARLVIALLSLLPSLGVIKLVIGYYKFHQAASRVQEKAKQMAKGRPSQAETLKLVYEYQLARASAPLIPEWVYNRHQDELNKLWEAYRPSAEGEKAQAGGST